VKPGNAYLGDADLAEVRARGAALAYEVQGVAETERDALEDSANDLRPPCGSRQATDQGTSPRVEIWRSETLERGYAPHAATVRNALRDRFRLGDVT